MDEPQIINMPLEKVVKNVPGFPVMIRGHTRIPDPVASKAIDYLEKEGIIWQGGETT